MYKSEQLKQNLQGTIEKLSKESEESLRQKNICSGPLRLASVFLKMLEETNPIKLRSNRDSLRNMAKKRMDELASGDVSASKLKGASDTRHPYIGIHNTARIVADSLEEALILNTFEKKPVRTVVLDFVDVMRTSAENPTSTLGRREFSDETIDSYVQLVCDLKEDIGKIDTDYTEILSLVFNEIQGITAGMNEPASQKPLSLKQRALRRRNYIKKFLREFYAKHVKPLEKVWTSLPEDVAFAVDPVDFKHDVDFFEEAFKQLATHYHLGRRYGMKEELVTSRKLRDFWMKYLKDDRFNQTVVLACDQIGANNYDKFVELIELLDITFKDEFSGEEIGNFIDANFEFNHSVSEEKTDLKDDALRDIIRVRNERHKKFQEGDTDWVEYPNDLHEIEDCHSVYKRFESYLKDFVVVRTLGRGGFGKVYEIQYRRNPSRRKAFKVLDLAYETKRSLEQVGFTEWEQQRSVQEQDLLRTKDVKSEFIATDEHFSIDDGYLVREHFDRTLEQELNKNKYHCACTGRFEEERVVKYLKQLAQGMAAAHRLRLKHRDLSPNNIGIAKDGNIRIFDFGLSDFFEEHPGPSRIFRIDTRDPLVVAGEKYQYNSDVYSIGAITYMMLTGSSPIQFTGDRESEKERRTEQNVEAIKNYQEQGIAHLLEEARGWTDNKMLLDVIEKTVHPDRQKRIRNAMRLHEFIQNYESK